MAGLVLCVKVTGTFGTLATVKDPEGKQRTMVTDGLGRLTNVIEDSRDGSPPSTPARRRHGCARYAT